MSDTVRQPPPARRPGLPLLTLILAGSSAAFAVASCCALPLILSALGIGSAGLAGLALVAAPHRTTLLVIAAVCLGAAAVLLWHQGLTVAACAAGGRYSHPAARIATMAGLGLGCVLLVLGYLYV